jgi:superfamily I DNA/RNA helicase
VNFEPEIILGPPGTGKTTTLIQIVEEELGFMTEPSRIAYLSFTRRAADEAIERSCKKFGMKRIQFPHFRTLHSLCFKTMGMSSSGILEGSRLETFSKLVGYTITGRYSLDDGTVFGFEKGDRLLFMDNVARMRGIPLREVYDTDDDELSFWEVERFSKALAQYKADTGTIDFTDMLIQFEASETVIPIDVLLVDEAQDLSLLQWRVVRKLARTARRVVIAGDDDQAIYRWAGADVDTLISMQGSVRVLDQSYRVPRAVQRVADEIIGRVSQRRPKEWRPRDEEGSVTYHPSVDSVDLSGPDVLVLGRNRYMLREFERNLRSLGYLYEFQGIRSIRPSLLEAVLTWERLRQSRPGVLGVHARKMYEWLSVGVGVSRGSKTLPRLDDEEEVTLETLTERGGLLVPHDKLWFDALDKMSLQDVSYMRAARRRGENLTAPPRIRLSTIHGIKGGQAQSVVILTDMAQRTFREAMKNPEDEARVWYVAVTRAREKLHIVAPTTMRFYRI